MEEKTEPTNTELLKEIRLLKTEVWYNRVAIAIFLAMNLFYTNLQTSRLGDILGTFIQMFMPEG